MPYIKDENNRRIELRNGELAKTAGELNYQIFTYFKYGTINDAEKKIYDYAFQFLHNGNKSGHPNYQKYNDMAGVMVLCTKEIRRRLGFETRTLLAVLDKYDQEINNYEDSKIIVNGDV